jgi:hypothetical protein
VATCCTCGRTDAVIYVTILVTHGRNTQEERQVCSGCQLAYLARKSTQARTSKHAVDVLPGASKNVLPSSEKSASPGSARSLDEGDLFTRAADGADGADA